MAVIFVSYARENSAVAARVAHALEFAGHRVWWDRDLPAYRPYADVIAEELAAADAVLVLWSREASKSEWVRAEADAARIQGKLVQASIDGVLPPMPFNQYHSPSLERWDGRQDHAGWKTIRSSVEKMQSACVQDPLLGQPEPVRTAHGHAGRHGLEQFSIINLASSVEKKFGGRSQIMAALALMLALVLFVLFKFVVKVMHFLI